MKNTSKKILLSSILGMSLVLTTARAVFADTATSPWIPAQSFTSDQPIINAAAAYDGNVNTFATITEPNGLFGSWQFDKNYLGLPDDAVIDRLNVSFHTQNDFFQQGCIQVDNLNKADGSDGMAVTQLSIVDGDTYSSTSFSISPNQNAGLWTATMFDVQDFSSWKLVRGLGGCFIGTPRNFNEAYIQAEYTYTPIPSPAPTPEPSPSPSLSPSPSVSPQPSPSPTPPPPPHHPTPRPWWWPWWLPWPGSSNPTPHPSPIPTPTATVTKKTDTEIKNIFNIGWRFDLFLMTGF